MDVTPRVVRLSFAAVIAASAFIIMAGALGGLLAQQFLPRASSPLALPGQQLVTSVQEVTISPSTVTANQIKNSERGVVTLAAGGSPLATGLVVTNDGLVVTAGTLPEENLTAVTADGRLLPVSRMSIDAAWGLTYLRLTDGIFVPLEIAANDPDVGSRVLAVGQALPATGPWAQPLHLTQYTLPTDNSPANIQRLLVTTGGDTANQRRGSPLLNDAGKVAGLLLQSDGLALPATALAASVRAALEQKLAADHTQALGLHVRYTFIPVGTTRQFGAAIERLKTPSAAATAGLKPNDIVIRINNQPLAWEQSVIEQFAQPLPLAVTVLRADKELTFILTTSRESPAP